jgi:hypothetical protein
MFQPKLTVSSSHKAEKLVKIMGGSSLPYSNKGVTVDQVKKIMDGVIASSGYMSFVLNAMLGGLGDIKICTKKLEKQLSDPEAYGWLQKKGVQYVVDGKFKGVWTRQHVLTIGTTLYRWYEDERRNPLIWGTEQAAKTIVYCSVFLLLPCIEWLARRRLVIPLVFSANRNNITLSAQKELECLLDLYEHVELIFNGERLPLSYVRNEILDKNIRACYDNHNTDWTNLVFNREPSALARFVEKIVLNNKDVDCTFVPILDEVQIGSAVGGLVDRVMQQLKLIKSDQELKALVS